jgi:hypothetical protein
LFDDNGTVSAKISDESAQKNAIKPLRARHNKQTLTWIHEPHVGKEATSRRDAKLYYECLARAMLRPDWALLDGNISYTRAAQLLRQHRDFPKASSAKSQRLWVNRAIRLVCKMPNVFKMPRFIMLLTLLEDHGGEDAIKEHHAQLLRNNRRNKARWAREERKRLSKTTPESARISTSQPRAQIVETEASFPLTPKTAPQYNAVHPPLRTPVESSSNRFVPAGPKPANAVSASRASKLPKSTQANIPGFGSPLISSRSQSDKTLAQPALPGWLKADWARPDFDPRTNPKAKRVYAHGPLDAPFVSTMIRVHKQLAGLSYAALRKREATNDTLLMACHLMVNAGDKVTKPVRWVMWAERQLRLGKLRYA